MRSTAGLKIAVFDTETDPFLKYRVPVPFCCAFYDGSIYIEEWGEDCVERAMVRIAELDDDYLIYCHNGGKFDFWFFLDQIDDTRQMFIINGRLTEFSMKGTNHVFRDSLAILPIALSEYQKEKINYRTFERRVRERHKASILRYLKSDCVNLLDLVSKFSLRFADAKGNTPISIGQTSIRELIDLHPFDRMTEASDADIRPFYYGGRVQCFQAGILKGPWRLYDVNGLYPSVMASHDHPLSDLWESLDSPPRSKRGLWFAEFEGSNRQALPSDTKAGLDFTLRQGTFRACSHELVPAIDAGLVTIDKWLRIIKPSEFGSFGKFVTKWSQEKIDADKRGDKAGRLFAKLIANAAYGKTGQNPADFKDYALLRDPMRDRELRKKGYEAELRISDDPFIELWTRKTLYHNNGFYNVGIAASVTSAARAVLLEGLRQAVEPIYCDTDSIVCRSFNGDVDPYRLGAWKLEKADHEYYKGPVVADYAAIYAKKGYCLYNKVGRKIVPIKWASKGGDLTPFQIIEIAQGKIVEHTNEVPTFSLSRGISFVSRKFRRTVDKPEMFA